jgi:hypothetical protein
MWFRFKPNQILSMKMFKLFSFLKFLECTFYDLLEDKWYFNTFSFMKSKLHID